MLDVGFTMGERVLQRDPNGSCRVCIYMCTSLLTFPRNYWIEPPKRHGHELVPCFQRFRNVAIQLFYFLATPSPAPPPSSSGNLIVRRSSGVQGGSGLSLPGGARPFASGGEPSEVVEPLFPSLCSNPASS